MSHINKIPKYCKGCTHLWTKGIKTGGYSAWCCKFGKPASKSTGQCKMTDSKKTKGLK